MGEVNLLFRRLFRVFFLLLVGLIIIQSATINTNVLYSVLVIAEVEVSHEYQNYKREESCQHDAFSHAFQCKNYFGLTKNESGKIEEVYGVVVCYMNCHE